MFTYSHPGYFGKVGMRNFHVKKTSLKQFCPTINVEKIWSLLGNDAREQYAKAKSGKAPVLDLTKHVSVIFVASFTSTSDSRLCVTFLSNCP